MHSTNMPESAGAFGTPEQELYECLKCNQKTATCKSWESSCGGYEDYKYECQNPECKHSWWVEGIDS